jgi:hypothetical protein
MIALMMEAANTSETSVNFYQTFRRNNPEDSHLNNRCRENLKSHLVKFILTKMSGFCNECRLSRGSAPTLHVDINNSELKYGHVVTFAHLISPQIISALSRRSAVIFVRAVLATRMGICGPKENSGQKTSKEGTALNGRIILKLIYKSTVRRCGLDTSR